VRAGGTVGGRVRTAVGAMTVVVAAAGCGAASGDRQVASAPPQAPANGYITIVAADPIAPVLEREASAFEAANRLATVTVEAGASSTLASELRSGRVADVFVADGAHDMDAVVDADLVYGARLALARGPVSSPDPLDYSAVMMSSTGDQITSRAFMKFLTTRPGRSILADGGFQPAS
jgi:ABC-type molybdate transport system substrate-binding protein